MTSLRKAAQQALTEMANARDYIWLLDEGGTGVSEEEILNKIANLITALRAALAEPVPDSKHATIAEWWADKQRKPLTGEEIDQIAIKCLVSPVFEPGWNRHFARAIERAHGIS